MFLLKYKTCFMFLYQNLCFYNYAAHVQPLQPRSKEGLHGLSQTVVHWSSHQPNAVNTRLQPLTVQLKSPTYVTK